MGLIKGKSGLQKLLVGYPTVSDKYDVVPATLEGADVINGDVVMYTSNHSIYKKAASVTAADKLAGIVLATNVKTPSVYPANTDEIATKAGEQFNLIIKGYVAVKLDTAAELESATEGAAVYVTADGALTTEATSNFKTTWKFTGVTETHGTAKIAEIVM